jgi:type IX secretion system PorP/SprF family membrane protein
MMKKFILISLFAASIGLKAVAQQDPMISQYMFNGLFLNPAYAGSHKYFTTTLNYRKQWVNFDGAPQTVMAAIDGPIPDKNMGVGLIIMNDQIGVTRQNSFMANYSYQIKTSEKGKLSLGLSLGVSQYRANLTSLTVWDDNDEVFMNDLKSNIIPRFGFGVYYFQELWYAGISIPTLLAYQKGSNFSMNINNSTSLDRHYFLTGGLIFKVHENIKLRPSTLIKILPNAPIQADLNLSALFYETIWVGASFRSGDALVGIIEYQTNARFRVGYAYDLTFSKIRNFSAGSHELMIGYDLGKEQIKVKSPRYF